MQEVDRRNPARSPLVAPSHILVATDLTDMDSLTPHAIAQASASRARVTLVNAIGSLDLISMQTSGAPYFEQAKLERDTRLVLLDAARRFEAQGIRCETVARRGQPQEILCEELKRTGATRLIMGTHGRHRLGQLVLGSVARDLLSRLDVPIFAVGPYAHHAARHARPRRILHPVSLAGDYRESFRLAVGLAELYQAELTLLHVLGDLKESVNPERTREWAANALDTLAAEAADVPRVHAQVRGGGLAEEIMAAATRDAADWIILGADGSHRYWHLLEAAAYKVLAHSTLPVMTFRHHPHPAQPQVHEDVHLTSPL
jgi:nucleotide-binding universal stress UspA family protein